MYLVATYDVPSNRRRGKLFKLLAGYLRPVQKSVFEGEVSDGGYNVLIEGLGKIIDRSEDSIRIYRQCGRCQSAIQVIGPGRIVEDEPEDIII